MNVSTTQLALKQSGFTLIELMVTIAVLAIIVSIAAPNISTQLANQRVKSTTAILISALKEAKVESIIRRQNISISYNNNGTNSGTITVTDSNNTAIASYQYDAKISIKSTIASIGFTPNKTVNENAYTICDSSTSASARQVGVSPVANISDTLGGTCP